MTDHEKLDRLICRGRIPPPPAPMTIEKGGLPHGPFLVLVLALAFVAVIGVVVVMAIKPDSLAAFHHERNLKCR